MVKPETYGVDLDAIRPEARVPWRPPERRGHPPPAQETIIQQASRGDGRGILRTVQRIDRAEAMRREAIMPHIA
jgi:hypothetical protein